MNKYLLLIVLAAGCSGTIEEQPDAGSDDPGLDAGYDAGPGSDQTSDPGPADPGGSDPGGSDPGPCSGRGSVMTWDDGPVCACDAGFTPSSRAGVDCVPTPEVCVGGPINYDFDDDGQVDDWFEPNEWECWMYELVNLIRATHDDEGTPECHKPLDWSVEWSAHGRNHSIKMKQRDDLFHDDFPYAQNVAYGCDPPCEMDMYMNGWGEGHCPPISHHCIIMGCSFDSVGIGYEGDWNTQNFL